MTIDPRFAIDVLRAAPAVTYVYDLKAQESIFQSRRISEIMGQPPSDKPGALSEWIELIHPEDRLRFPEHRERLRRIRPGETISWEYRLRAPGGSWRWYVSRDVALSSDSEGNPHLIVGTASDITDQKTAEQQKDLLLNEMRHRSRNVATVVSALAQQTRPKDAKDGLTAYDALVARLSALFRAGELLLGNDARTADLESVARAAVTDLSAKSSQMQFSGPHLVLTEQLASALTLVLHELATNAVKYGPLSTPAGSVSIGWQTETREDRWYVILSWIERGGPEVVQVPTRKGFGTRLISTAMPGGQATFDYTANGLTCTITFPLNEKS